jgi:2-C-methyl-D-erythritol 2,4-cyclodiphosphate synthase
VNLDCTVLAQRPKLSPYKRQMAARIAQLLGVSEDAVSVKAKTGEKVGSVGLEEAIDAHAVILLTRPAPA